jgi:hypothetical protein
MNSDRRFTRNGEPYEDTRRMTINLRPREFVPDGRSARFWALPTVFAASPAPYPIALPDQLWYLTARPPVDPDGGGKQQTRPFRRRLDP